MVHKIKVFSKGNQGETELDATCLKNIPPSDEYSSCEEKKRLVAIKSEGSAGREAEVVQFYEMNENEHVGMR